MGQGAEQCRWFKGLSLTTIEDDDIIYQSSNEKSAFYLLRVLNLLVQKE